MVAPTYGSITAPVATRGFFVQPETSVRWSGTLDVTSWLYGTYGVSVGFTGVTGTSLGQLATAPRFQHNPNMTKIDAGNMLGTLYEVTGEETTVTVAIREFRPNVIKEAFATGVQYNILGGTQTLISFGQGCTLTSAPLVIEFTNVDCGVPVTSNVASGIIGGILTLYSVMLTGGINWEMVYGSANSIELVFTAQPVTTRALGDRIGSLYLY